MNTIRAIALTAVVLAGIAGMAFYSNGLDLWLTSFFAPRQEAVRYKTFKQSQAFNEGMANSLSDLRVDFYAPTATDAQKQVILATVRQRFASYDVTSLPPQLQQFYNQAFAQ